MCQCMSDDLILGGRSNSAKKIVPGEKEKLSDPAERAVRSIAPEKTLKEGKFSAC